MQLITYLQLTLVSVICIGLFMPLDDPLLINKYFIQYISNEAWNNSIANNNTALEEGTIQDMGDSLRCYIPNGSTYNSSIHDNLERNETELNNLMIDNLGRGVNIINKVLNSSCVSHPNGYWNYEYCSGDKLTQFHISSRSERSLVYTLGKAPASVEDRQFQLLYNEYGYYISEFLNDGQYCEVTGYPRITEIQYTCGPSNGPANFQWARETKTCVYEARINIPELCDLELLSMNDDKKRAKAVTCVTTPKISYRENTFNQTEAAFAPGKGIVDVLAAYDPTFLGYSFYLLNPKTDLVNSEVPNRSLLMYSGTINKDATPEELYNDLYLKSSNAVSRMMFMKYLLLPDNQPFQEGDKFKWIVDLIDMSGTILYTLTFNINEKLIVDILNTKKPVYPDVGNFINYQRKGKKLIKLLDTQKKRKITKDSPKTINSSNKEDSKTVDNIENINDSSDSKKHQSKTLENKKVTKASSDSELLATNSIKLTTTILTTSTLTSKELSSETSQLGEVSREGDHRVSSKVSHSSKIIASNSSTKKRTMVDDLKENTSKTLNYRKETKKELNPTLAKTVSSVPNFSTSEIASNTKSTPETQERQTIKSSLQATGSSAQQPTKALKKSPENNNPHDEL